MESLKKQFVLMIAKKHAPELLFEELKTGSTHYFRGTGNCLKVNDSTSRKIHLYNKTLMYLYSAGEWSYVTIFLNALKT